MNIFTQNLKIHNTWSDFISQENIKTALARIQTEIGENYTPAGGKALRFLETDLSKVKVIILGQDPYPQQGVATGRAFEVGTLKSWDEKFKQSSLRNILRAVYVAYNEGEAPPTLTGVRCKMNSGEFEIAPPNKLFESLEKQGVLFLNTTFTCEIGNAGSHIKIWENFSENLFRYISCANRRALWFLWGKNAHCYEKYARGGCYKCNHPMLAGGKGENDFLKSKCFFDTKDTINWKGM
ncbi:MAG: uracil-DNA glycosylase [Clostridiales bacterium]|jgi:uracil-DNA glycosylase|nr:uracil-DNA glycosylase [Clostridiales bacterium]